MKHTPIIHAKDIATQQFHGIHEFENGEHYNIVQISLASGDQYLVAGSACNTGLIPEFARKIDVEYCESVGSALHEFIADLEEPEHASDELLAWHGSMVI